MLIITINGWDLKEPDPNLNCVRVSIDGGTHSSIRHRFISVNFMLIIKINDWDLKDIALQINISHLNTLTCDVSSTNSPMRYKKKRLRYVCVTQVHIIWEQKKLRQPAREESTWAKRKESSHPKEGPRRIRVLIPKEGINVLAPSMILTN